MKKRYWIVKGLYTIEMVMVQAMWFEYLHEWRYRDDNFYNVSNACAAYQYDTSGELVIGYERALIRIPCRKFNAKKIELMLYASGDINPPFNIKVYEILQDFDIQTVTWNNQPPYDNLILKKYVSHEDFTHWVSFDITNSFTSWFDRHTNPPSYILIAENEGVEHDIFEEACFETERGVEDWRPYLNITF